MGVGISFLGILVIGLVVLAGGFAVIYALMGGFKKDKED